MSDELYRTGGNSLWPPFGLIWKDFWSLGTQVPFGTRLPRHSVARHSVARHSVAASMLLLYYSGSVQAHLSFCFQIFHKTYDVLKQCAQTKEQATPIALREIGYPEQCHNHWFNFKCFRLHYLFIPLTKKLRSSSISKTFFQENFSCLPFSK